MSLKDLYNIQWGIKFKILGGIFDDAFMLLNLIYFMVWF
jgi:hypothetical protein